MVLNRHRAADQALVLGRHNGIGDPESADLESGSDWRDRD